MDSTTPGPTRSGFSRRTVVAGAAWAVPVVALAAPAALAACSGDVCVSYTNIACKVPGASGGTAAKKSYRYNFTMLNGLPNNECVTVLFYTFTVNAAPAPDYVSVQPYNGGQISSCTSCTCLASPSAAATWAWANRVSLPGYSWPLGPGNTEVAPASDYFGGWNPPGNVTTTANGYICLGAGPANALSVWVVGGEFPNSAQGSDTYIRWVVLRSNCTILKTDFAHITSTPPDC